MKKATSYTLDRTLPFILMAAGLVGLLASLVLTYDKIQILQNPSYNPVCNLNPIFSCLSIMKTEQASLFGMPNTVFGIIGYTALLTFGVLLASGARFKRGIWIVAQVGATLGLVFMHYLFFQGVYRIGAICPWCFLVWMITIPTFWYVTLYNLRTNAIVLPQKYKRVAEWLQQNHGNVLGLWYVIIFLVLLERFWYYWKTLI